MTVNVRKAAASDSEALAALNVEVQALHAVAVPYFFKPPNPDTFPPSFFAGLMEGPDNIILIAETDEEALGYAYCEELTRTETAWCFEFRMLYLHQIGVRAGDRRRGIGAALVAAMRAEAKSRNISVLALDTWTFNSDAQAFFRREGFEGYMQRMWCR